MHTCLWNIITGLKQILKLTKIVTGDYFDPGKHERPAQIDTPPEVPMGGCTFVSVNTFVGVVFRIEFTHAR